MNVREATIDDSIELTKMYRNLYEEDFSMNSLIPIDKTQLISKIFLAQEKNTEVGFIWINFIAYGIAKYGYIEELYVKPAFRNKGYGSMLVEKAKEFFQEQSVHAVFVSIDLNNESVAQFYKKHDFNQCKGQWFYFTDQN